LLFMGFSSEEFSINPKCVVIGSIYPHLAGVLNLDFQLEGYFNSDQSLYKEFSQRVADLKTKNVSSDAIIKIDAALRYLRLGSDVKEIGNKLLNYWIGMEYFFSSSNAKKSKTKRMREYFRKLDGKIYYKRLLIDFHKNIKLFGIETTLNNYSDDLAYLNDESNFAIIEANTASPLLSYRASRLKQLIFKRQKLVQDLQRHAARIEWNILRIYRMRNAVVHSAKNNRDLLDITSHLRHYLIFVINFAIDFFNNSPHDINMDGRISLDDFFLVNQSEFDNLLMDTNTNVTKIISFRNPIEFLS
jgi:hypothetical protein